MTDDESPPRRYGLRRFNAPEATVSNREKKKRSKKMEKATAKRFGGKRQPMSGAHPDHKGDVVTPHFLFDDKSTVLLSFSVTQKILAKLCDEARSVNKSPALQVKFEKPIDDMKWYPKEWTLIPSAKLQELIDAAEKG